MRLRPLVAGLAVSALSFAAFWELAGEYAESPAVAAFDATVTAAIQSMRTPPLTAIMLGITALGSTIAVTGAMVVVVLLLLRRGRRADAVFTLAAIAGGSLLSTVFKGYFDRVRPPAESALIALPSSFSFPSGHAMGSLCLAWVLGWLACGTSWRTAHKAAVVGGLATYAVLVGVSRVYLGVHWPSDVVASWLLGAAWLGLVTGVMQAAERGQDCAPAERRRQISP